MIGRREFLACLGARAALARERVADVELLYQEAQLLQIGFAMEVTGFQDTGIIYDNLNFAPIPVPAAVWLFGSGLLGLVGVARRRRKA